MNGGVSPTAFRLATLTLELVERRRLSLEAAFLESIRRVGRSEEGALALARMALLKFAEADYLLKMHGLDRLPLRRRCAFRVAYALAIAGGGQAPPVESGLLSGKLRTLLSRRSIESLEQRLAYLPPLERLSITHSFPPWILRELAAKMPLGEVERLVKACSKRTLWLRVNELKTSVQRVAKLLRRVATVVEDRDFPELLELAGVENPPLEVLKLAERGLAVIQDKGSVAVVHALAPRAGQLVLDAAAAPGLKTSLIQQLAGNEAEVVAVDASRRRLEEAGRILSKLGVKHVHLINADSASLKLAKRFDRVLLDAPCSNSGAIASDPALRLALWKGIDVERYAKLQIRMLENSLRHLKEGGLLVYSTCSLLSDEGERVVDSVLEPEMLDPSGIIGVPGYPGFSCSKRVRRLYPHLHRTEGFFVSRYRGEKVG